MVKLERKNQLSLNEIKRVSFFILSSTHPAIAYSEVTTETLEQGVKYVQRYLYC